MSDTRWEAFYFFERIKIHDLNGSIIFSENTDPAKSRDGSADCLKADAEITTYFFPGHPQQKAFF